VLQEKRITKYFANESSLGRARHCRGGSVQSAISMHGWERYFDAFVFTQSKWVAKRIRNLPAEKK
jgi:hypothetical protein